MAGKPACVARWLPTRPVARRRDLTGAGLVLSQPELRRARGAIYDLASMLGGGP
jgi:hypothetical protein